MTLEAIGQEEKQAPSPEPAAQEPGAENIERGRPWGDTITVIAQDWIEVESRARRLNHGSDVRITSLKGVLGGHRVRYRLARDTVLPDESEARRLTSDAHDERAVVDRDVGKRRLVRRRRLGGSCDGVHATGLECFDDMRRRGRRRISIMFQATASRLAFSRSWLSSLATPTLGGRTRARRPTPLRTGRAVHQLEQLIAHERPEI